MADSRKRAEGAATEIGVCLEPSTGGSDPPWSVHHTETVVLACARAGAQPLPDGYGEGQGRLPEPISKGGATHPWPASGNTCGPVLFE